MPKERNNWIGRTLSGRYEILEVIGQGAAGVIFKARQLSVDRLVAIKMMHAQGSQSHGTMERFQTEARACSKLSHPNTVRLYDFGQTTLGNFYMVMELLEGRSLRTIIAEEAPLPAPRVLRILMQCAASLAEAHAAGIVHRDLKPENIILLDHAGTTDFVKVLDFSIVKILNAHMTEAGTVFGTPHYMSPEQARGVGIDGRSDIYSLGVLAYAMLTNTLPFHDADPMNVLRMHLSEPVPPLPDSVPSAVANLVLGCLQKNPEMRPASALDLLEACRVWLTAVDPALDLASDPALKNTLIDSGPPEQLPGLRPSGSVQRTMLSASGQQRKAAAKPSTEAAPKGGRTLVHASPVPPTSAPTQLPSASPKAPPAKTTVASSPAASSAAVSSALASSGATPAPHAPDVEAPAPTPAPFSAAPRVTGPIAKAPQPPTPIATRATQERPPVAIVRHPTPQPVVQQSSRASFVLACCLVAVTFGLGGYYITWALR